MSRIGRRLTLIIAYLGFIVGGHLCVSSSGFVPLLVARLVTGIFCGVATVAAPMYLIARQRSLCSLIPTITVNFGIVIGILIGIPLRFPSRFFPLDASKWNFDLFWWRVMVLVPAALSILPVWSLLMVFTFDTPEVIRQSGGSAAPVENFLGWGYSIATAETEKGDQALQQQRGMSFLATCRLPSTRWRLLAGFFLAGAQQFSGMPVFVALSTKLFSEAGVPGNRLSIVSASMAALQLLFSVAALPWLHSWRRKLIIAGGCFGMGLSLLPSIVTYFGASDLQKQYCSIFSTLSFASIYSFTFGPILLMYLTELYEVEVRDVGISIAFSIGWASSFAVLFIASFLSQFQCFVLFACICLSTGLFTTIFCPETLDTNLALKQSDLP